MHVPVVERLLFVLMSSFTEDQTEGKKTQRGKGAQEKKKGINLGFS